MSTPSFDPSRLRELEARLHAAPWTTTAPDDPEDEFAESFDVLDADDRVIAECHIPEFAHDIVELRNSLRGMLEELERSEERRAILENVAAILFNETRGVPIDSEAASAFAYVIQRALAAIPAEATR